MQEEKLLWVIRGPQGSGKSDLAIRLTGNEFHVFEADKSPFAYMTEGKYDFNKQGDAHKWNKEVVEAAMKQGLSPIAVSNTSKERWNYQPYLELAAKYGYTSRILWNEAIELPDGSSPNNVHEVPEYVVDSVRCKYQPHIRHIENPFTPRSDAKNTRMLRLIDRDGTLIYNPVGGVPTYDQMCDIPGIRDKVIRWKAQGDILVVVSNQGGLEPNRDGIVHKTKEQLLIEAKLIYLWFRPDLQIYSPKLDGSEAWVYSVQEDSFHTIERKPYWQSFRKPQAGMIEYAMLHFDGCFTAMEMIGNDVRDYHAALAANIPYKHIHNVLYS